METIESRKTRDGKQQGLPKADSHQVNAEKVITVTGYYPDCQAQEKIGNY
jgi:hypothetical protein